VKYSVRWRDEASDELATIWLKSESAGRREVTKAADAIDKALANQPTECGESRGEKRRIFYVEPLAVIFQVSEPDRTVNVLQIWTVP
jgi:plasmid stabilization system protein ParE